MIYMLSCSINISIYLCLIDLWAYDFCFDFMLLFDDDFFCCVLCFCLKLKSQSICNFSCLKTKTATSRQQTTATCPPISWRPPPLIHVSPTRTWHATATSPMWTSIVARRSAAKISPHATTSRRSTRRCAPMRGSRSGTSSARPAHSRAASKSFVVLSIS